MAIKVYERMPTSSPLKRNAQIQLATDLDAADRRAGLERSLARLPDSQRVPLVLFHFEGLSYEDIARQLGISLSKVKTDILRGRTALARILGRPA